MESQKKPRETTNEKQNGQQQYNPHFTMRITHDHQRH